MELKDNTTTEQPLQLHGFKYFAELQSNISSLQVVIWNDIEPIDVNNYRIQYECVDGLLTIKLNEKVNGTLQQQTASNSFKIKLKQSNLHIFAKQTCIYVNDGLITLRFTFDKSFTQGELPLSLHNPCVIYSGPKEVNSLTCSNCDTQFVNQNQMTENQRIKIKAAPSENWKEVVELWQCHDEDFEQFIDLKTKQIKVPDDVCLVKLNQLQLSTNISNLKILGQPGQSIIICNNCQEVIGIREDQDYIFLRKIKELQGVSNWKQELLVLIYNHGRDNLKQDMVFLNTNKNKMLKIKVLNSNILISSSPMSQATAEDDDQSAFSKETSNDKKEGQIFVKSIKLLYNQLDQVNPDVLDLLTQMNKTYVLLDSELQELIQLLKDGQKILHTRIQTHKNGLYQISYLEHNFD
eukprot:403345960